MKVTNVNVATPGSDVGYGLSALLDLLLANGWTIQSTGTGTGGTRAASNQLTSPALWIANTNTWAILFRGNVYVTLLRTSASNITVKFAVVAPSVVGSNTVPDSQVTAANETSLGPLSITGSSRAHAVSVDTDSNAAGIRSFYLLFTDGTATPRGFAALEAMANGTYATANPAPYAVTAATSASPLAANGGGWAYWYSPTSVWSSGNSIGTMYSSAYLSGTSAPAGVNPWSSEDQMLPATWGRPTGGAAPGLLGVGATIRTACTFRSYPNTVNLASDAGLYCGSTSGASVIPWPNGVTPL